MGRARMMDETGATAVEYAIMAALIAMVIFTAVALLGGNLAELYECAASAVGDLPQDPDC